MPGFFFSLSKRSNKDVSKANGIVLAGAAVTDNSSRRRRKHPPPPKHCAGHSQRRDKQAVQVPCATQCGIHDLLCLGGLLRQIQPRTLGYVSSASSSLLLTLVQCKLPPRFNAGTNPCRWQNAKLVE